MKLALILLAVLAVSPVLASEHESHGGDDELEAVALFLTEVTYSLEEGDLSGLSARERAAVKSSWRECSLKRTDKGERLVQFLLRADSCEIRYSSQINKLGLNPSLLWRMMCESLLEDLYLDQIKERCQIYLDAKLYFNPRVG